MSAPLIDVRIGVLPITLDELRREFPTLRSIDLRPPAAGPEVELTFEAQPDWQARFLGVFGPDYAAIAAETGGMVERALGVSVFASRARPAPRCARDSDWCDGVLCRERGIRCPNSVAPMEGPGMPI